MQTSVSENEDSVIEHTLVGGIADLFLYIGGKARPDSLYIVYCFCLFPDYYLCGGDTGHKR